MSLKKNKFKDAGFTLLEVIMALSILAVSLISIYGLQGTSLRGAFRAGKIEMSTQLAREKMALALIEIEDNLKKGEFPEDKEETGTFEGEELADYSWKLIIRQVEIPVPEVPGEEGTATVLLSVMSAVSKEVSKATREVKLTVSWKEGDEEQEGIVLTTHVVKM